MYRHAGKHARADNPDEIVIDAGDEDDDAGGGGDGVHLSGANPDEIVFDDDDVQPRARAAPAAPPRRAS